MPCDKTMAFETPSTCFKDCDSTIGIWNDPPIRATRPHVVSPIALGQGEIQLPADSSIAALLPKLLPYKGRKVGCLFDGDDDKPLWHSENLLPRYLFNHDILCQRIYPSEQYGYVDENRLFCWPVALSQFDAIAWVKSEGDIATAMRTECRLAPLRQFVRAGGRLFLGGRARALLPCLLENSPIDSARMGIDHMALFGEPGLTARVSGRCCELLRIDEDGSAIEAASWELCSFPHGYQTAARYADGLILGVSVCFAGHDTIALEWRAENHADSGTELRLACSGDMSISNAAAARCAASGHGVRCDFTSRFSTPVALTIDEPDAARWQWEAGGESYRGHLKQRIERGGLCSGTLLLGLCTDLPSSPKELDRAEPEPGPPSWWQRAEARWQRRFDSIAPLAAGDTRRRDLLRRAAATISANTWRLPRAWQNGNYGGRRVLQVQRSYYPGWYPYEAGLYACGVRNFDAPLARDLIELFIGVQAADGWVPLGIFNRTIAEYDGLSQIPTLAYGAWRTWQAEPNTAFLQTVYPGLRANIDWWYANRRPTGGRVFGFAHGQEGGGDDHPRSDEPGGGLRSGMKRYLSPDASGFVLMEMQCLARMAGVLGHPQQADDWRRKIADLDSGIAAELYDAEANFFCDREIATRKLKYCQSPWNLAPLWAGVSLPPELAQAMVRDSLAGELMRGIPFPIVGRSDPAYLRDVYWRGPSWPQVWLMCLQILWWYGFESEADGAADTLMAMCEASPYLMEIYDSQSGEGLSLPEYSMAASMLFEIAARRYREDPPWRAPVNPKGTP